MLTFKTIKQIVFTGLCLSCLSSCIKTASFVTKPFNAQISSTDNQTNTQQTPNFIIIAHRGASGYLPEHSKEAAVLAYMQGADYIEQDLVVTKDDELIVLHDIYLERVTNVETVFPNRKRKDNRYYAVDFTLAELRRLSLHERQTAKKRPVFSQRYRGKAHFSITTFREQVELIRELNRQFTKQTGKTVGWYPEMKSPKWHLQEGKDLAELLAKELNELGLNKRSANIFVQSFDPTSLQRLKNEFGIQVRLIQLIGENTWNGYSADYNAMKTKQGLEAISKYADGIGPWLRQIYDYNDNQVSGFLARAKEAGLQVHPYTHREDAADLPDTPKNMFFAIKNAGADGIFTDQVMPYMLND